MIARLRTNLAKIQGITLYMQAAQDITIGARLNKTQFQYTMNDRRSRRTRPLDEPVPRKDQGASQRHRCRHRSAQCRADARHQDQARRCLELRHPALHDRQHARRRLRPAYRLDDLHHPAAIPRHSGGRPQIPVWAGSAQRHLCQIIERTAGADIHAGRFGGEGRAARGQPPGPVPVGDDLVQSGAGRRDRPGGKRHSGGRESASSAALAADQLPGQRPGLRRVAEEHADPHHSRRCSLST